MSPLAYLRTYLSRTSAIFTTKDDLVTGPVAITGDPPKSRFRLDNDSSHTFTLPDGRNFGYAQYGSQTGRPIVYLHGLPGSRIEAAAFDDLGQELGARIISVDRPGIGWSSPHFGRKILDHAKDIDDLATHLELDDYGVLVCVAFAPRDCPRLLANSAMLDREYQEAGHMHLLVRYHYLAKSSSVFRSFAAWAPLISV